jgi:RND family efflux transporter MFP subunit
LSVKPSTATAADTRPAVLRNSLLNLAGQGLYALVQLAFIALLARGLDGDGFGTFYVVFTLVVVAQILLEVGLTTVLTRRLTQAPQTWRETAAEGGGLCVLSAASSAVVFLGVGLAWACVVGEREPALACAAAGVACAAIQVQRFCAGVLHAFESFMPDNVARLLQGLLFLALLAGLALAGELEPWSALAALAASNLAAAGFLLVVVHRRFRCLRCRLSGARARHWLAESVPLWLGDLGRGATRQAGTLLLWGLATVEAVAVYSVAYRPLGPLELLPRVILQACFPSFARLALARPEDLGRPLSTTVRVLWVLSLPIAVTVCVGAEPLVVALAGPPYREAALPMRIASWIVPCLFVSLPFRFVFTALGRSSAYVRLALGALLLEGALVAALTPLGAAGACLGALLGEVVFTAAGVLVCRRLGIRAVEGRALASAALAAAVMGGGLWWFRHLPLPLFAVAAALAALGYFALCVGVGAIRVDEVRRLRTALQQAGPHPSFGTMLSSDRGGTGMAEPAPSAPEGAASPTQATEPLPPVGGQAGSQPRRSRWRMAGVLLAFAALAAAMGWLYLQSRRARNMADPEKARKHGKPIPVRTARVARVVVDEVVGGTGLTYPSDDTPVTFGQTRDLSTYAPFASLILDRLHVHEGDVVSPGQLLYEVHVPNFDALLRQQAAALKAAELELEHVKKQVSYNRLIRELTLASARQNLSYRSVDLDNRRKALDIFAKLSPTRAASDLDYFRARSAYYAAQFARSEAERDLQKAKVALPVGDLKDKAHVAAAESAVEAARAAVLAGRFEKGRMKMTSPAGGVVTFGSPTEPSAGQVISVTAPLLHVLTLDPVHVLMDLPQERIDRVVLNMRAEVVLDAFPKETFTGTLLRISPQVNPQLRVVPAIIRLKNPGARIKAGISGFVRLRRKRKALTVPATALVQRGRKAMVIRVEKGRARFREVRTGHQVENGVVEVLEGLKAGDEVVIFHNFSRNAPSLAVAEGYLKDNDPVDVDWRKWARRE